MMTMNLFSDLIRNINDPEHPLTLEQLNVVALNLIEVKPCIEFPPTNYFHMSINNFRLITKPMTYQSSLHPQYHTAVWQH